MATSVTSDSFGCTHTLKLYIGVLQILARPMPVNRMLKAVSDLFLSQLEGKELTGLLAYIDAVKSVLDPNPMPPGLHQYSIVVYTPQREMKFTAPTKERHDIWFRVCKCFSNS
jgi:Meiotic cell cortex C-terminal pleckstrin homology